jgi:hypothetical protein
MINYQFYRSKPTASNTRLRSVKWKYPPIGWLKINIDDAFLASEQMGGIWIIIRNNDENCVGYKCERVRNVSSPEQVAALAGRCVVRWVQEKGLSPIVFETDSMILSSAIKQQSHVHSPLGPIYEAIVESISTLPGSLFHHVYRRANGVAHCIARHA